jgi:hypothetical protein
MTPLAAALLGLGLAGQAEPSYCLNPPARASEEYWDYIATCGCARLYVPPRASSEYERFTAACRAWNDRHPQNVVTAPSPTAGNPVAAPYRRQCGIPPSRATEEYWTFIASCGCGNLLAPSRASLDYDRFMKACDDFYEAQTRWRLGLSSPSPAPSPRPSPSPPPSPSPSPAARPSPAP